MVEIRSRVKGREMAFLKVAGEISEDDMATQDGK
jgi:hypothetical protein